MLLIIRVILFIFFIQRRIANVHTKKIKLDMIGLLTSDESQFYSTVQRKFNEYAIKENLNIELDLVTLSNVNSTASTSVYDFVSIVESLYQKKEIKYDIVFYLNHYIDDFDEYFIDLYKYLNETIIDLYDPNVLTLTCIKNNKLVGLPITNGYDALYYNKELLKKYNKEVPRTWDDLIIIGKEIVEKEKKI